MWGWRGSITSWRGGHCALACARFRADIGAKSRVFLIATPTQRVAVMKRFIAEANIEHFRRKLAEESDPKKRAIIQRLLDEEQEKLAAILAEAVISSNAANG
jgi:Ser-tRNA(Ala) deacylase AlaX